MVQRYTSLSIGLWLWHQKASCQSWFFLPHDLVLPWSSLRNPPLDLPNNRTLIKTCACIIGMIDRKSRKESLSFFFFAIQNSFHSSRSSRELQSPVNRWSMKVGADCHSPNLSTLWLVLLGHELHTITRSRSIHQSKFMKKLNKSLWYLW